LLLYDELDFSVRRLREELGFAARQDDERTIGVDSNDQPAFLPIDPHDPADLGDAVVADIAVENRRVEVDRATRGPKILGRHDAVDDEHLDGVLRGHERKAELRLERGSKLLEPRR